MGLPRPRHSYSLGLVGASRAERASNICGFALCPGILEPTRTACCSDSSPHRGWPDPICRRLFRSKSNQAARCLTWSASARICNPCTTMLGHGHRQPNDTLGHWCLLGTNSVRETSCRSMPLERRWWGHSRSSSLAVLPSRPGSHGRPPLWCDTTSSTRLSLKFERPFVECPCFQSPCHIQSTHCG